MIKVQQWGNSQGIRLPKEVLEAVGLKIGDKIEWLIQKGKIVLRPFSQPKEYLLKRLLRDVPKDWDPSEVEWGNPLGKEVW